MIVSMPPCNGSGSFPDIIDTAGIGVAISVPLTIAQPANTSGYISQLNLGSGAYQETINLSITANPIAVQVGGAGLPWIWQDTGSTYFFIIDPSNDRIFALNLATGNGGTAPTNLAATTSPQTYTNTTLFNQVLYVYNLDASGDIELNGVDLSNGAFLAVGTLSTIQLRPSDSVVISWATTAPVMNYVNA